VINYGFIDPFQPDQAHAVLFQRCQL